MVKALLFDFDGTLADTGHILFKVYDRLTQRHNIEKMTHEELHEMRSLPIRERFKKAGVPFFKLPSLAAEAVQIFGEFIGSAEPFPGIEDLIRSLKDRGYTLAIVSSNTHRNINSFLAAHNLEYFDVIQCSSSLFGKHKIIKRALKEINLKSDQAIYIGDEYRDIAACKKIPIRIISVLWGYDYLSLLQEGKPDYIAEKPGDILTIVEKM
ncbi:MAG: HAD-IA family hydrolase [Bacillota bacterium]